MTWTQRALGARLLNGKSDSMLSPRTLLAFTLLVSGTSNEAMYFQLGNLALAIRLADSLNKAIIKFPNEQLASAILLIRGENVMIDSTLATLYGVETKAVNRAVKRNLRRFPPDFMFQLTAGESAALRCQTGTSKGSRGGRRYRPFAFTEQGVAMLSTVLNSDRAVLVNIEIMRTFVKLRRMLNSNAELARGLKELESKYDRQFKVVFDAIRHLTISPRSRSRRIGFRSSKT